jgi:hypothetical protein
MVGWGEGGWWEVRQGRDGEAEGVEGVDLCVAVCVPGYEG